MTGECQNNTIVDIHLELWWFGSWRTADAVKRWWTKWTVISRQLLLGTQTKTLNSTINADCQSHMHIQLSVIRETLTTFNFPSFYF